MRREGIAILCLLLAGRLFAWGGTTLNWLDGTQPWDTTPMNEVDLQASGGGGDGVGHAGLAAQWGVLDDLQATGQWLGADPAGDPSGELDLRLREPYYNDDRPDFSVYGRAPFTNRGWQGWGGVSAAMEPWDSDLAANAEMGDAGRWRVRLAAWSPYLIPALRLGFEASWLDASAEAFTPQFLVNAPGDLSLQGGLKLSAQGSAPLWTARLSYQLFQNP